jgi:GTPase Era involved in 16S rRNA processing
MTDTTDRDSIIPNDLDQRKNALRSRVDRIRQGINTSQAQAAIDAYPECAAAVKRILDRLDAIEGSLQVVPPIDVVVLGPSRHGKSTLLNSLVQTALLPTSDTKPCTASILSMTWAPQWSIKIKFVDRDQLIQDWSQAVKDAAEAIHNQSGDAEDITLVEPRYVKSVLQRFVQLFRLDPDLPASVLLERVREAKIPADTAKWLGKTTSVNATELDEMRRTVERYLSTKDVFWTIIEECKIFGPFPDWHPSLQLVDLPGTNDTDPRRTAVTNSLREKATAVAIVTSDSNIGPDIESWLRNSSVLATFLEATSKRRQRLFIIRTKLDSYHPTIDEASLIDASEEEETQIHVAAVESYKREQTATYCSMLRDIAGPKLPQGYDDASKQQRTELLGRIDEIPVFFVSALAHEIFCNRFSASIKTRRQQMDYFDGSIEATGIPGLRQFLVEVADEYLADNFYDDLELSLESEVSLLASTFRKAIAADKAQIAGGQLGLRNIVDTVQNELIPWIKSAVTTREEEFKRKLTSGATGIAQRLQQVSIMSARRIEDKLRIWTGFHWASLRAVGRKQGIHVTSRGEAIDINEDICSVLVDDVLLAWTHFRDYLIEDQISTVTSDLANEIASRLKGLQTEHAVPELVDAIQQVSAELIGITTQQRQLILQTVNNKIRQVESIRKPAYVIAQEEMSDIFHKISHESGSGCSQRMQRVIRQYTPAAIEVIRSRVNGLIESAVNELSMTCTDAIGDFGNAAAARIQTAVSLLSDSLSVKDCKILESRIELITEAIKLLPGPSDTAA